MASISTSGERKRLKMGTSIRMLMFATAIILGVYQYNQTPVIPGPKPDIDPKPPVVTPDALELVIDSEVESFPSRPSESLVGALAGLSQSGIENDDALKLARAFRDWAIVIEQDTNLKTLNKYVQLRAESIRSMVDVAPLTKDYRGKITPILEATYKSHLKELVTDDGVKTEITPAIRAKLVEYHKAISWKFSSIWLETVVKDEIEVTP
jgi:hypothetical protein